MQKRFLKKDKEAKYKNELYQLLRRVDKEFPKTVKDIIYLRAGTLVEKLVFLADECDSPIEFILGESIEHRLDAYNKRSPFYYHLHKQVRIKFEEKIYRVDFLLAPVQLEFDTDFPNLIIECDGHDFHERSKEQAKKDKQKDRDLQLLGYKIIHFTGSEIINAPVNCVIEIFNLLERLDSNFVD